MQMVNVLYKYVDGAHFFVSDDDKTLGLCVAHKDPIKAYEAVGATLTVLFRENHGEEAIFIPGLSVHAFLKWFADRSEEALGKLVPTTAGGLSWSRNEAA